MRIAVLALSLLVSTFAQANILNKMLTNPKLDLNGKGTWAAMDGSSDKWEGTLTVEQQDSVVENTTVLKLTYALTITHGDESMAFNTTTYMVVDENMFFNVLAEDNSTNIGSGYCVEEYCHYEINNINQKREETWNLGNDSLVSFGSLSELSNQNKVKSHGVYTQASK